MSLPYFYAGRHYIPQSFNSKCLHSCLLSPGSNASVYESSIFLIFFTVNPYCPRAEFGGRSDSLVPQRPFQAVASLSMVPKVFGGLTGHRSLSWKNDVSCQSHPFCFTGVCRHHLTTFPNPRYCTQVVRICCFNGLFSFSFP